VIQMGPMIDLLDAGAWTWFHNPRAIYHKGRHSRTYWTWSARGIWIGAYDHGSGTMEKAQLQVTKQNDHNVAAVGVRPDGRILAVYSAHNGTLFSRISSEPESVAKWGDATAIRDERATYPNLFYLGRERRWYLFYRAGPTGKWPIWFRTSDDDGASWSDERIVFRNGSNRPYLQVVGDGLDQIHLSLTDGYPNVVPDNSIYHLWYDSGAWRNSSGRDIGSPPFEPSDLTVVFDGGAPGHSRAWCWDVALDRRGRPVMAFASIASSTDHTYHYAVLDGGAWRVSDITAAGRNIVEGDSEPEYSAGLAIDHRDTRTVFLSRETMPDRWELERWTTDDRGSTWTSDSITEDSPPAPFKNFRPTSVRGGGPFALIWAAGDYVSYREFDGGLRALPRREPGRALDGEGPRRSWTRWLRASRLGT